MEKVSVALIITCLLVAATDSAAQQVGVCYGWFGYNLPSTTEVVEMYTNYSIWRMRMFEPMFPAMEALRRSGILVAVGIRNRDLEDLVFENNAAKWFANYIEPYVSEVAFTHIVVGDEVIPGPLGKHVLPIMKLLQSVIDAKAVPWIKLTTVVSMDALAASYPPSSGAFSENATADLSGVLGFLSAKGSPLMVNVYPYFAYASDPAHFPLEYAQFTATSPIMDGPYSYYNLFDMMLDAFVAALEKAGAGNVELVVSESGWPSAGNGQFTSVDLAGTYNRNLVKYLKSGAGTPRRPGIFVQAYIYAMFSENAKTGPEVERNFGLFYPNKTAVYPVF